MKTWPLPGNSSSRQANVRLVASEGSQYLPRAHRVKEPFQEWYQNRGQDHIFDYLTVFFPVLVEFLNQSNRVSWGSHGESGWINLFMPERTYDRKTVTSWIFFLLLFNFSCPNFSPVALPCPAHPSCSHSQSPSCCPCPWVLCTCSLMTLSLFLPFIPPSPLDTVSLTNWILKEIFTEGWEIATRGSWDLPNVIPWAKESMERITLNLSSSKVQ